MRTMRQPPAPVIIRGLGVMLEGLILSRPAKILALSLGLVFGPTILAVACGGTTPIPLLPPPEYERPTIVPWDAGMPVEPREVPSSPSEEADAGEF